MVTFMTYIVDLCATLASSSGFPNQSRDDRYFEMHKSQILSQTYIGYLLFKTPSIAIIKIVKSVRINPFNKKPNMVFNCAKFGFMSL